VLRQDITLRTQDDLCVGTVDVDPNPNHHLGQLKSRDEHGHLPWNWNPNRLERRPQEIRQRLLEVLDGERKATDWGLVPFLS